MSHEFPREFGSIVNLPVLIGSFEKVEEMNLGLDEEAELVSVIGESRRVEDSFYLRRKLDYKPQEIKPGQNSYYCNGILLSHLAQKLSETEADNQQIVIVPPILTDREFEYLYVKYIPDTASITPTGMASLVGKYGDSKKTKAFEELIQNRYEILKKYFLLHLVLGDVDVCEKKYKIILGENPRFLLPYPVFNKKELGIDVINNADNKYSFDYQEWRTVANVITRNLNILHTSLNALGFNKSYTQKQSRVITENISLINAFFI